MIPTHCDPCKVYGYCTTSELECQAYQEGFGWGKTAEQGTCTLCQNSGYCTGSDQDCDDFRSIQATSVGVEAINSRVMPANKGLVNWISGSIVSVMTGDYMALVTIQAGDQLMTSMLAKEQFESLGYKEGDVVTLAVKAVNVKIMR